MTLTLNIIKRREEGNKRFSSSLSSNAYDLSEEFIDENGVHWFLDGYPFYCTFDHAIRGLYDWDTDLMKLNSLDRVLLYINVIT